MYKLDKVKQIITEMPADSEQTPDAYWSESLSELEAILCNIIDQTVAAESHMDSLRLQILQGGALEKTVLGAENAEKRRANPAERVVQKK